MSFLMVSLYGFHMISIFLNLLRLLLWPIIGSVLENVPYAFDKNVYSASVWWSVLYISISFIWSVKYNWSLIFPSLFSVWMLYLLLKMGCKSPQLLLHCLFLSSDFLVFMLKLSSSQFIFLFPSSIPQMAWLNFSYITVWSHSSGYPPICKCSKINALTITEFTQWATKS